jgi:putative membrane protein
MRLASDWAVALVALLHLGFLVLEMFLWDRPPGQRVFGLPRDVMVSSRTLAANQGLYNGFLAAGLAWGLWRGSAGFEIQVFFLCCVVIAGVYGAVTAKRSILWIQGIPGLVALLLVLAARWDAAP